MATKPRPADGAAKNAKKPDPEARLQEALAQLKAATDRQQAVISVLSRVGVSAQDKRLAQAEGKKVDHALREAKRLVQEAQALTQKP